MSVAVWSRGGVVAAVGVLETKGGNGKKRQKGKHKKTRKRGKTLPHSLHMLAYSNKLFMD